MADMIDFQQALQVLGCDEATLQNMIDNGTIRAERSDGQLLLNADDVQSQSGGGGSDSDSILVLDSESEDMSIDLGEVVDDGSQTMDIGGAQTQDLEASGGTESLTFGDELDVPSFDDGQTEELDLDTEPAGAAAGFDDAANTENLSFTDSNTAVITDVDETVVGSATATSDYQTVDFEDEEEPPPSSASSARSPGVRRSVRQTANVQEPRIHPFFAFIAILTFIAGGALLVPILLVKFWPSEDPEATYYNGDRVYGIDDTVWSTLAGSMAGFSVDPVEDHFRELHPDDEWIPLNQPEGETAYFRFRNYMNTGKANEYTDSNERAESFVITDVDMDEEGNVTQAYHRDPASDRSRTFQVTQSSEIVTPEHEMQDEKVKNQYDD